MKVKQGVSEETLLRIERAMLRVVCEAGGWNTNKCKCWVLLYLLNGKKSSYEMVWRPFAEGGK